VFKNWVLRRTFGPKRDDVTGGWRTPHNKELLTKYLGDKIEKNSMGRACSTLEEKCIQGFGGET
jgi:hypothetical protein